MNCSKCNLHNNVGARFCVGCGNNLTGKTEQKEQLQQGGQQVDTLRTFNETITPRTEFGWNPPQYELAKTHDYPSLNMPNLFILIGSLSGFLGFFLPIFGTGKLFGGWGPNDSLNGVGLGQLSASVYIIAVFALSSLILHYGSLRQPPPTRLITAGYQVMIGASVGPLLICLLVFVPMLQQIVDIGFILIALGFCSTMIGGMLTICEMSKFARSPE